MESVWHVFKECWDKGRETALATPLSNFETNQGYKDRQDPSITLIFRMSLLSASSNSSKNENGYMLWEDYSYVRLTQVPLTSNKTSHKQKATVAVAFFATTP